MFIHRGHNEAGVAGRRDLTAPRGIYRWYGAYQFSAGIRCRDFAHRLPVIRIKI